MGNPTVLALRIVIALVLAGSLFVQVVLVPLFWADLDGATAGVRIAVVTSWCSGVCVQVTAVCVWRLLTMVRRGTVFSDAAFRFVDVIVGAIVAARAGVRAGRRPGAGGGRRARRRPADRRVRGVRGRGRAHRPGARMLLAQAVARDVEATQLRAELDEVI